MPVKHTLRLIRDRAPIPVQNIRRVKALQFDITVFFEDPVAVVLQPVHRKGSANRQWQVGHDYVSVIVTRANTSMSRSIISTRHFNCSLVKFAVCQKSECPPLTLNTSLAQLGTVG